MNGNSYLLMNQDDVLLEFQITENGLGQEIIEKKSFSEKRPIGFTDIATWIENRNYAKHKQHFKKWIAEWGIDNTEGFLNVTHALGINDTLWVKAKGSNHDWDSVNLYTNPFTDIAQKTAFETGLYGLQLSSTEIISPEFTSDGTCPKCWKKEENGIFLYKAGFKGAANCGLEPYSEYISSMIAKEILQEDSIPYDLVIFKDRLCSKCKLFTNEQYGYVPFYKLIDANRRYTLNDVLKICSEMGYERECRKMILIDSIVFNQDRHLGNFGFLVDNHTFRIVGFAPLFDYNLSMLCNAMMDDLRDFPKYEREYQVGHKLGGTFSEVGKAIITPELLEIIPKTLTYPIHDKYWFKDKDRTELLLDITEKNIRDITERHYYNLSPVTSHNIVEKENVVLKVVKEPENTYNQDAEDWLSKS